MSGEEVHLEVGRVPIAVKRCNLTKPYPSLVGIRRGKAGERGGVDGKGVGEGETAEKLWTQLFRPLVINLMIICQQNHYQKLFALECK